MRLDEVMKKLESLGTEQCRKTFARHEELLSSLDDRIELGGEYT